MKKPLSSGNRLNSCRDAERIIKNLDENVIAVQEGKMNAFWRNAVLIVCMWFMLAGVCFGKQVYLKDGSYIDCQSFWRHGDQVIVKINRDTMLDFERSEIDVRRTFRGTGKKSHHVGRRKSAGIALTHRASTPHVQAAVKPVPAASHAPAAAPEANQGTPPNPPVAITAPKTVQPETAQPTQVDPSSPPDKTELERQGGQAQQMMAEALKNKDPELMKKAMEAQGGAIPLNAVLSAIMSPVNVIIFLLLVLLAVVSTWIVFERAGHSGLKSLIPIYNIYVLMLICGKPGWWLLLMFIPLVGAAFYLIAMLGLAEKFGKGALFGIGLFFLPMFFFPALAFGGSKYKA
jgi:hypothetical protein